MSGLMPWDGVVDLVGTAINKIWPDKTKQQELQADLAKAQLAGQLQDLQNQWDNAKGQLEVNRQEAASTSLFVSGWRPFIGWVCGSAFAWAFVLQPMLVFFIKVFGSTFDPRLLPSLDFNQIQPVLYGMLGLGAMRTVEKLRGAAPPTHA